MQDIKLELGNVDITFDHGGGRPMSPRFQIDGTIIGAPYGIDFSITVRMYGGDVFDVLYLDIDRAHQWDTEDDTDAAYFGASSLLIDRLAHSVRGKFHSFIDEVQDGEVDWPSPVTVLVPHV